MSEMLVTAAVEHMRSEMVVASSLSRVLQVNLFFYFILISSFFLIVRLVALVSLLANSRLILLHICLEE